MQFTKNMLHVRMYYKHLFFYIHVSYVRVLFIVLNTLNTSVKFSVKFLCIKLSHLIFLLVTPCLYADLTTFFVRQSSRSHHTRALVLIG